jgi:magnesium-transporting ATPase (P-type)
MTEEKKNGEKDNCPLSPTDWVMFLSEEIFNEENKNNRDNTIAITTLLAVATLSIISLIFTVINSPVNTVINLPTNTINNIISVLLLALSIFIILIFIYLGILLSQVLARLLIPSKTQKRVEALKKLRQKIIFGKEKDCIKIREKWDEIYRTIYPKKRIRYGKKN